MILKRGNTFYNFWSARKFAFDHYKPFNEIHGPVCLPIIGTLWKYFPVVGNYNLSQLDLTGQLKLTEYGEIVREVMGPGGTMINVFNAEDIEKVFKAGGTIPQRKSHAAIRHYRMSRPQLYSSSGLFPTNGEEWWILRRQFQQAVSPLQETRMFLPSASQITEEFLTKAIPKGKPLSDFLQLISFLNLELTWQAVFGERLNSFISDKDHIFSGIIHSAEAVNEAILLTDTTEFLWKKWPTKIYKELERNLEFIEKVAIEGITRAKENKLNDSIVSQYLSIPSVNGKDVLGMVIDLLLGGVDTTSYTSCFLLYHVSKSASVQDKLRREAFKLLTDVNDPVTLEVLNNAHFARAVLKETFRLNPISIGTTRIIQEDTVLSGYHVPKGTLVICQNMVACSQEKNFKYPNKFLPERWLKENKTKFGDNPSPYLVLPFGYGLRSCIARRRAEQNLLVLLIQVARKFEMEWIGGSLGVSTPLINKPNQNVKFIFK